MTRSHTGDSAYSALSKRDEIVNDENLSKIDFRLLFRTIIVYLHKRNFEISNSVLTNEKSMNLSFAMLSRGTKNAS